MVSFAHQVRDYLLGRPFSESSFIVVLDSTDATELLVSSPRLRTISSSNIETPLEVLDINLRRPETHDVLLKKASQDWIAQDSQRTGAKSILLLDEKGSIIFGSSLVQREAVSPGGAERVIAGDVLRYVFCGPCVDGDEEYVIERRDYFKAQLEYASPIVSAVDEHGQAPQYTSVGVNHGSLLATILFRPSLAQEKAIDQLDALFHERGVVAPLTRAGNASKRTLFWVHIGPTYDLRKKHFNTAAALDLRLVVIENPGHWISDPAKAADIPSSERPFAFLPVDLNNKDALVDNLVSTARRWEAETGIHIDGITTAQDDYLAGVCEAAIRLGLPTSATPDAYLNCVDKYRMRALLPWKGRAALRVQCRPDLDAAIADGLEFPVIIKPQSGGGSQGVYKVISAEELYTLWDKDHSTDHGGSAIIEPFVEGAEVDFNVILQDGQLLSYEMSDNEPTPGDGSDDADPTKRTFFETCAVAPSVLPLAIQERLRDATLSALHTVGFARGTGIFHCEARVHPSGAVFMIEINARMPGFNWPMLAHRIWGVDQVACTFLAALGRPVALAARTFRVPAGHAGVVSVCGKRGGVLANDPFARVRGRADILCIVAWPPGFRVADSGASAFYLGMYIVVSTTSTADRERRKAEIDSLIAPRFVD